METIINLTYVCTYPNITTIDTLESDYATLLIMKFSNDNSWNELILSLAQNFGQGFFLCPTPKREKLVHRLQQSYVRTCFMWLLTVSLIFSPSFQAGCTEGPGISGACILQQPTMDPRKRSGATWPDLHSGGRSLWTAHHAWAEVGRDGHSCHRRQQTGVHQPDDTVETGPGCCQADGQP